MTDRAPKRSYISMRAYNNDFFSYATSVVNDFETVGTLSAVAGANAGNCPQGRILTETGRKLYPGANPGITHLMVGVFDYATGLSGFIDPNSAAFTPQNTDRPYYFTSPGANTAEPNPDRAPPVFTRGDLLAQGNLDLSGAAHIYGAVEIDGTTTMNNNVQINGNLDLNGKLLLQNVGIANMASGTDDGSFRRLNVTTSAYTSNSSFVFLTLKGLNSPGTVYSAEPVGLNTFQIVSNSRPDQSVIQWLVVN
jgi:hypothetical protein